MVGVGGRGCCGVQAVLVVLILSLDLAAEGIVFGEVEGSYCVSGDACGEVDVVEVVVVFSWRYVVLPGAESVWWDGLWAGVHPGPYLTREAVRVQVVAVGSAAPVAGISPARLSEVCGVVVWASWEQSTGPASGLVALGSAHPAGSAEIKDVLGVVVLVVVVCGGW